MKRNLIKNLIVLCVISVCFSNVLISNSPNKIHKLKLNCDNPNMYFTFYYNEITSTYESCYLTDSGNVYYIAPFAIFHNKMLLKELCSICSKQKEKDKYILDLEDTLEYAFKNFEKELEYQKKLQEHREFRQEMHRINEDLKQEGL